MVDYVVYYRVSTQKQERSGLGLESQRSMIERFLQSDDVVLGEFTEVQSGKKDNREELWKCINLVKKTKSKLLIPRLDRFSRKVSFISGILDTGIEIVVSDNPNVSRFHLHLLSCFCEEERRLISERTRLSLQEAKAKGTILGKNGFVLGRTNREQKLKFVKSIEAVLSKTREEQNSLSAISRRLNQLGTPTFRGGKWYPSTVRNYLLELDHGEAN
ncbi:recombinase family protein [Seongchinamella sediminis]|uniref:Recombinase family protein n=1 Tax=Seongchinamella sediminis TaxID=2283635 RepID=A0A3L7DXU8_9GAMM|nr:recombinase family protein [Seongchinamella sediminis]RLQ22016.1 recombinase family protein [Seongchinamella sediminis]